MYTIYDIDEIFTSTSDTLHGNDPFDISFAFLPLNDIPFLIILRCHSIDNLYDTQNMTEYGIFSNSRMFLFTLLSELKS